MNHFDVQRAESLMRYAEFLKSMDYHEYVSDVINLLHGEIVGIDRFKEFDSVTECMGDNKVHQEFNIHPEVKKYIYEQINKALPEVYEKEKYEFVANGALYHATETEDLHPKLKHYIRQLIKETVEVDSD